MNCLSLTSIACLAALQRHGECLSLVNRQLEVDKQNPDLYVMRARLHEMFNNVSIIADWWGFSFLEEFLSLYMRNILTQMLFIYNYWLKAIFHFRGLIRAFIRSDFLFFRIPDVAESIVKQSVRVIILQVRVWTCVEHHNIDRGRSISLKFSVHMKTVIRGDIPLLTWCAP